MSERDDKNEMEPYTVSVTVTIPVGCRCEVPPGADIDGKCPLCTVPVRPTDIEE